MFEVAYVGTSGNRLLMTSNINAATPGLTDPVARRPYGPALGEIREVSNGAHSTYHGLQSKFERRFARGLYFLGSYTWSKSLDNQSNGTDDSAASGQFPQDPQHRNLDAGSPVLTGPTGLPEAAFDHPFWKWPARPSGAARPS